jgi:hypothetical protein
MKWKKGNGSATAAAGGAGQGRAAAVERAAVESRKLVQPVVGVEADRLRGAPAGLTRPPTQSFTDWNSK